MERMLYSRGWEASQSNPIAHLNRAAWRFKKEKKGGVYRHAHTTDELVHKKKR